MHLRQCPRKLIPPEMPELLAAAELAEKGTWPEAGGSNDQPAAAVEAIRYVWRCQAEAEDQICKARQ